MTKTISKTKRTLALVAIFFSTLAVMADLAITPVIGMIYGYYPDHTSAVNYIVSRPMLGTGRRFSDHPSPDEKV